MKFEGTRLEEKIRGLRSPEEVPYVAYKHREGVQKGWFEKRDRIMTQALRAKFEQHPELNEVLIGTDSNKLVFHSEEDPYYGDGGDGTGQNMLGTMLEELRRDVRSTTRQVIVNRVLCGFHLIIVVARIGPVITGLLHLTCLL